MSDASQAVSAGAAAPVEFWFDFSSPYAFFASREIDAVAARHGRTVTWRPFLLGVAFRTTRMAPLTEQLTGGKVRLRILSNLADLRLARAQVRIAPEQLDTPAYKGVEVIEGVIDAYTFAAIDPYRAATHNKGIMNGIDPLVVATGNDWRAVEAGAHAYACRNGDHLGEGQPRSSGRNH